MSPPRKSAREPSAAKKENANVPICKPKEKTNAQLRKAAAPFPMSQPKEQTSALPRKAAAPFPMSPQPKEKTSAPSRKPTAPFPMSPLGKSAKQPLHEPTGPNPFALPSRTSKPGIARSEDTWKLPCAFPVASPVQPPSRDKGKRRALTPQQDEDDVGELAINHRDTPSIFFGERAGSKRASDDSDGARGRKARRGIRKTIQVEIDRVVDPSTVCPYCDEPLPAQSDSTTEESLGDCEAQVIRRTHVLEILPVSDIISKRTPCLRLWRKDGPQSIDFKKVPKRVERMKGALEAIITDADDRSDNEDSVNDDARGPRARSDFWREIKKQIKKQGSRIVTGVKGQFASFEKTQPGYYGELGLLIIHQTLYNLFPFSSFDPSSIAPLTPAEFIQLVLIPEAAVGLIMQDLHLDRDEAIVTLRESSQYGVAMFPDTGSGKGAALGGDDDDDEARRLELEEEEKIEEQMWKEERAKRRSTAQMERKEKARQRAEQLKKSKELAGYSSREVSEASESETQRRPFRHTAKAGSRTATDSETDNMSVDSLTSRRSTRSRTGAGIMYRTASAKSGSSDMQISDDSAVDIVDENEQPQVRRSSRHAAPSPNDIGQHFDAASSSKTKTRTGRLRNLKGDDRDADRISAIRLCNLFPRLTKILLHGT
ncbi:RTC4-like domain-containing protein [Suillus lakei]|nr:RTC4-like domain-containing protein [Suillus lakei]